ncbi:MAG: hypothetical protein E6J63_13960 [Deltaproteobacteria bacterium]|nr:MAG: hypothetical protein E6J63_13960 [Deltaproteobacteria bacterium]
MTLGRLVSAAIAVLLSSACGSSMGNTSGGGSGAGGGATDGGGGDAGTGGDGGSATYTISVRINGNGGVRAEALGLDCRAACDAPGQAGTHVSFVPVADSGSTFDGWGGLCSGNGPCEVVVQSDRTLWATFVPATSDGGGGSGGGGSGEDGGSAQDGGSPGGFAIELHPTNAHGCEGIIPSSAPVPRSISLELKYSESQGNWFDGLSVDGLGDVAAEFNSDHSDFPSDERRLVIYDLDGGVVGQVPGGFLKSQPDGFLSHRTAVDYGQADTLYGWTRSASNSLILDRAIPNPAYVTFGCQYALPPISGALVQCWEADAGTWLQYYDESMQPSSTRNQIPDGGTLAAIDERGMVIENGPSDLYWMDTAGARHSGSIDAGTPPLQRARQLIGGGFDTAQGLLQPDATALSPRPAWLSSRDGLPLVFVRGGRAYAAPSFVSSSQCQRRIELLLPDGTSCGTIDMREADDCASGAPMVGARGTVLEVTPLDSYDGGTRTVEYRVFPRLLE